jgi:hypothetical protein
MRSPYVAEKTFVDLDHRWVVRINKKQFVDVFVWKTLDGLYDNTHFRDRGHYLGAYIGVPDRKKSGLFGEIHLWRDQIGAGYVAHEIMHLVFDWMVERDMREFHYGKSLNERSAWLMGDITTQFWNRFYEFYDVVPSADAQIVPDDR